MTARRWTTPNTRKPGADDGEVPQRQKELANKAAEAEQKKEVQAGGADQAGGTAAPNATVAPPKMPAAAPPQ